MGGKKKKKRSDDKTKIMKINSINLSTKKIRNKKVKYKSK
jgi:hypothetical protein